MPGCSYLKLPILVAFILSATSFADSTQVIGKVVTLNGKVSANGRQLTFGDSVMAGDSIRTQSGSNVKLLMLDRSILDLGESTVFSLKHFNLRETSNREVDLELELGRVRASVTKKVKDNGRFRIRTPASMLAVRGTEFRASWDGSQDELVVLEGTVSRQLHSGDTIALVTENSRIRGSGNGARSEARQVERLSPSEVQSAQRENISNNTFAQVLTIGEAPTEIAGVLTAPIIPVTVAVVVAPASQVPVQAGTITGASWEAIPPAPVGTLPIVPGSTTGAPTLISSPKVRIRVQ